MTALRSIRHRKSELIATASQTMTRREVGRLCGVSGARIQQILDARDK